MLDPTGLWRKQLKEAVREHLPPERVSDLKTIVGRSKEAALWLRSGVKSLSGPVAEFAGGVPPVDNVFHACVQKTGSQWISSVFRDRRIRRRTGLADFPQFRYEWGEFRRKFPKYTYVPGLYISRGLYEEIEKPPRYRTLYVVRDPRDVVLSWYYSMRESHRPMGKVFKHRARLRDLDFDDGLAYCIRAYSLKLSYMRSWAYAQEDPDTLFVKLEDLSGDPVAGFAEILDHCEVDLEEGLLEEVLADYTKEKMRERDLEVRDTDGRSHYRKESTSWREDFADRHREIFRDVAGNLPELLGYESTAGAG